MGAIRSFLWAGAVWAVLLGAFYVFLDSPCVMDKKEGLTWHYYIAEMIVTQIFSFAIGPWYEKFKKDCELRRNDRLSVDASIGDSLYHWPHSLGHVGSFSATKHTGPKNLTHAFAWEKQNPLGRFVTPGMGGTAIDDKSNIYINWQPKIAKFSPDGILLWEYTPDPHCGVFLAGIPVRWSEYWGFHTFNSVLLWGGALFSTTERGAAFAVSMDTGEEIWSRQVLKEHHPFGVISNSFVQIYEGILVMDTVLRAHGLNATTGDELWSFKPDEILWSFLASTPGDGTIVFQDIAGTVYRTRLWDGTLIWKAHGVTGSWTDGSAIVGPNNIVYAVNADIPGDLSRPGAINSKRSNKLRAYNLDGKLLWQKELPKPPNNVPAIVRLKPGADFSVVQAMGLQNIWNETYHIHTFDAATGELQWVFDGPRQIGLKMASYDLPLEEQKKQKVFCIPTPWGAPTIDATGTVYIGNQEGPFFALRDSNGDGRVQGEGEVSSFETMRAFIGSEAPSFAPGMIAVNTCDKLHVFKYSE